MAIYLKLGKKASGFSDPVSSVSIAGKEVVEVSVKDASSPRTAAALRGGHVVRATKAEYLLYKKSLVTSTPVAETHKDDSEAIKNLKKQLGEVISERDELKAKNLELEDKVQELQDKPNVDDEPPIEDLVDFETMTSEELVEYYKENFEVDAKQIKAFEKLSQEKMVEELEKLETTD